MSVIWITQSEEVGRHVLISELNGQVLVLVVYESKHARLVRRDNERLTSFVVDNWSVISGVITKRCDCRRVGGVCSRWYDNRILITDKD